MLTRRSWQSSFNEFTVRYHQVDACAMDVALPEFSLSLGSHLNQGEHTRSIEDTLGSWNRVPHLVTRPDWAHLSDYLLWVLYLNLHPVPVLGLAVLPSSSSINSELGLPSSATCCFFYQVAWPCSRPEHERVDLNVSPTARSDRVRAKQRPRAAPTSPGCPAGISSVNL
ncbi:hypothetical protein VTK56DRAFT_9364 [Thermocarpiscus australiensis]